MELGVGGIVTNETVKVFVLTQLTVCQRRGERAADKRHSRHLLPGAPEQAEEIYWGSGNLEGGTKNDCFLFQNLQSTVLALIGM